MRHVLEHKLQRFCSLLFTFYSVRVSAAIDTIGKVCLHRCQPFPIIHIVRYHCPGLRKNVTNNVSRFCLFWAKTKTQ